MPSSSIQGRINVAPDPTGAINVNSAILLELGRISYLLSLLVQNAGIEEEPQLPDMNGYLVANQ